uniref:G_PROTEIN_RECEP_F1_2 domain-containing protein n=1 Tax=Heterorhabditis bacteriophora TaxID=37862 RepID=A0A1I7X304_HETBA
MDNAVYQQFNQVLEHSCLHTMEKTISEALKTCVNMESSNGTCVDIREFLWRNQSDLTLQPTTMAAFALVYSLFITLGVVGNLLVVISVSKHKSLQSVRNIFIVSLSCSDIVVSVVSGSVTPITAFSKIWLFGPNLCYLVPLIQKIIEEETMRTLYYITLSVTA